MVSNLVQFGLVALGLLAALALFISLQRQFRIQSRKDQARIEDLQQQIEKLKPNSPEPADSTAASPAFRSGINVSKRTQALRLLRRGEDIGHVASALAVPRREIELLIRVQNLGA